MLAYLNKTITFTIYNKFIKYIYKYTNPIGGGKPGGCKPGGVNIGLLFGGTIIGGGKFGRTGSVLLIASAFVSFSC